MVLLCNVGFFRARVPRKKEIKRLFRIREEKEEDDEEDGEATLWSTEEEEEEGERRARRGNGAVEAWTDEVMDRVGVAS